MYIECGDHFQDGVNIMFTGDRLIQEQVPIEYNTVAAKSYGTIIGEKMAGLKSSIAIGLKSCFREWLRIITS